MQCRRVRIPSVEGLLDVAKTRALPGATLADMATQINLVRSHSARPRRLSAGAT